MQDNGFLSKNEVLRSKVSRLTERLRKRYPTNSFGMAQEWVQGGGVWLGLLGLRELENTWSTGTESKNCGHLQSCPLNLGKCANVSRKCECGMSVVYSCPPLLLNIS